MLKELGNLARGPTPRELFRQDYSPGLTWSICTYHKPLDGHLPMKTHRYTQDTCIHILTHRHAHRHILIQTHADTQTQVHTQICRHSQRHTEICTHTPTDTHRHTPMSCGLWRIFSDALASVSTLKHPRKPSCWVFPGWFQSNPSKEYNELSFLERKISLPPLPSSFPQRMMENPTGKWQGEGKNDEIMGNWEAVPTGIYCFT